LSRHSLWLLVLTSAIGAGVVSPAHASGFLLNTSFETCTAGCSAEGQLPDSWLVAAVTPDTYEDLGLNGLSPTTFGNFTGVTAHSGTHWVAGWAFAPEQFGQYLTTPLTAGSTYTLSGYLHQAIREDLNVPGGYDIYLQSDVNNSLLDQTLVGHLGDTLDDAAWYLFYTTFVAPTNAASLGFLMFSPTGGNAAYAGLDDVDLTGVPEPSTLILLASALPAAVAVRWRRSRHSRSAATT
jgi:hypothetical protein